MKDTTGPKVTESKKYKTGFTEVTWIPDFKRFGGIKQYTRNIINLYCKYVIDAAMLTKVTVTFNDEQIKLKTLASYA